MLWSRAVCNMNILEKNRLFFEAVFLCNMGIILTL